MKILIYHNTTDSDLKTGLQVCYKDINGAFTNLGVITEILTDKDGIKNYLINTSMGAYMADELKLIDNSIINHHSGMIYSPDKDYFVCGARNAWDTVKIGLFDNENDAKGAFPQNPNCVRKATIKEINEFFNIN